MKNKWKVLPLFCLLLMVFSFSVTGHAEVVKPVSRGMTGKRAVKCLTCAKDYLTTTSTFYTELSASLTSGAAAVGKDADVRLPLPGKPFSVLNPSTRKSTACWTRASQRGAANFCSMCRAASRAN